MAKYDFIVRETLKRDRVYSIEAKNEEEARYLLDGFKQTPKESNACQENIEVSDYDIKHVDRNDPQVGESVLFLDNRIGMIVGFIPYRLNVAKVRFGEGGRPKLIHPSSLAWDEEAGNWYEMEKAK